MFKSILCAVDGTASAERLLLYVMHFNKTEQAALHVVHAYQLPTQYAAQEGYDALIDEYRRVAQNVVLDVLGYLRETNVDASGDAIEGAPAEVILQEAERIDADLILIGSHNPQDVSPLLGSVSLQVLNAARAPVLVIP